MATRHNTCLNPALANDSAEWGGGAAPTRTAVGGFGRPFVARYTSGTFSGTARGAVVENEPVTLSMYMYLDTAAATVNGTYFIEWRDSGGGVLGYGSGDYSVPGQTVARMSATATAPAGAVTASLITEGFNFGGGFGDFTMVLIEAGAVLGDYFDGGSPSATWDGTPGNSASTLEDSISAVLDATLPPVTASIAAEVTAEGVLVSTLPALTASLTGTVEVAGQLAATLPPLAASLTGVVEVEGTLAATLPAVSAALTGQVTDPPQGVLNAVLPALTATLTGTSDATPPVIPDVAVRQPQLRQPAAGLPRLGSVHVGPPRLGGGV